MNDGLQLVCCSLWDAPGEKEIVEYEKVTFDYGTHQVFACHRVLHQCVLSEEFIGLHVMHSISLQDGIVRNGLGDVTLTGAWASDQHGVFPAGDKFQSMQLETGLFLNFRIVAPIKFMQRELLIQSRQCVSTLDLPGASAVQFVLQDQ